MNYNTSVPDGYEIDIDKCLLVPDFNTTTNEKVECIDIDHEKREFAGIFNYRIRSYSLYFILS